MVLEKGVYCARSQQTPEMATEDPQNLIRDQEGQQREMLPRQGATSADNAAAANVLRHLQRLCVEPDHRGRPVHAGWPHGARRNPQVCRALYCSYLTTFTSTPTASLAHVRSAVRTGNPTRCASARQARSPRDNPRLLVAGRSAPARRASPSSNNTTSIP